MSFSYPIGTWVAHSAAEHATDIQDTINAILSANNVLSGGTLVQLSPSIGNVEWLLVLGAAAIRADLDQALLAAEKSFSIAEGSDDQILSLLPTSGTSLLPATFSTVVLHVTADSTGVTVPAGSIAPFGSICNFVTQLTTVIGASDSADILAVADVSGPIVVLPGALTAFSPAVTHVVSVTNVAGSIPGENAETVLQVRQRLLTGNIADIGIDGTIRALRSIQGVSAAQVYFNFDTVSNLVLPGGITILPRNARIIIGGSDLTGTEIAAEYARRMTAPTDGAESQTYVTLAGQNFVVKYDLAEDQDVWVRVFYDPATLTADGFETEIDNLILAIRSGLQIGQKITAAMIDQALIGFQFALITASQVSLDGATWDNDVAIDADSIAAFDATRILVESET